MSNTKNATAKKKFKRQSKKYRLTWAEDHDNFGLEVLMRSLPIDQFLDMTELASGDKTDTTVARKLFLIFSSALLEWNLQDDFDADVPATYEGVVAQDLDFVMEVVTEWMKAMSSVDIPLPDSSTDAESTEQEASLPMEPL